MANIRGTRICLILTLIIAMLSIGLPVLVEAQSTPPARLLDGPDLPDSPGQTRASITGAVTDSNGAIIPGTRITLERTGSAASRSLSTDANGDFRFPDLIPGAVRLTVAAPGFATQVLPVITLHPGDAYELPSITLEPATTTNVNVIYTRHDMAEEEMKVEEKQRVLGIIPNFYATYDWHAVPLSSGQKFRLAVRTSVDPVSFLGAGVIAGIEQQQNDFSGYGQGAQGYAKRFGASYADGTISTFIGGAILPSVLRQDPRYFYKGTGTIRARVLYAISTAVICKGDNGRWQPNYSNVLGNFASAGISNLYYPASDRNGARLTIDNALIGTASSAIGALFQEFLLKKISSGTHP
jgi:hypothetical protein